MNTKRIKLELTVKLLNSGMRQNLLSFIQELMLGFKEAGNFLGLSLKDNAMLNPSHLKQTYAIQFEHCTLDVDLVSNAATQNQYVQGFQLR